MKKTFKFLSLAMLLSFVGTVSALAQKITGTTQWDGDVQYKITAIRVLNGDVKEATVSVVDNATPKAGVTEVTIPDKVSLKVSGKTDNSVTVSAQTYEFTVTEISRFGYANKNDVKKINIPATVKKIGADAFHNYASQSNIDLQIVIAAGSELETIGDCAFGNGAAKKIDLSNCNALDLRAKSSDPERVLGTPFASRGTGENNQLQEVILPNDIQHIGTAFANLPKLTTLDLSQTKVTVLEDGALAGTALTEVTIPAVTEPTVQTVKIGSKVFPKTVETLTINAPIAVENAIKPDAFHGMTALKTVNFNGDLLVAGAVPAEAFKDSKIEKVKFNNIATGAISADAFKGQDKLNSVAFNGTVAAGGIGANAFAGIATAAADCATVVFRKALTGEAAIGNKAFDGAAIKTLFFKDNVADKAISTYAFNKISCDAAVRFEGTLGAQAIGQYAFNEAELQYVYFAKPIDQIKAIDDYAFYKASISGGKNYAIRFEGALNAKNSIGARAFASGEILKDIVFAGDIAGDYAMLNSFQGFDNPAGTPVLFNGNISGNHAIGKHAFSQAAVSTVTINGNVSGENAIDECAFLYCCNNPEGSTTYTETLTSVVIKGEVSNHNAIAAQAFAGNKILALVDLQGNIYAANAPAIAQSAFASCGADAKLVVNFGPIKSSEAIAAGAFAGSTIDVVNYDKLMAEKAVADNQFSAQLLASRMSEPEPVQPILNGDTEPATLPAGGIAAATINTVNFNQEFKAWPEAENNASENFVGNNAFTGTKVKTVNFNAPISVGFAIYAGPDKFARTLNQETAKLSPFAYNGAEMTVNFNDDVVENGIAAYAFSYSNTVKINLANAADFGMRAFRNWSFYGITWTGEAGQHVEINYNAPSGQTDRSFAQGAFYNATDIVDIYFKTTKEVLALYTAENNASDLTPYRIKGIATKYIEVVRGPLGEYYGVFSPENEMYVIEKYQDKAKVGVWSAYYDDLTLRELTEEEAAAQGTTTKFKANDRQKYTADLYINPLRAYDNGKYVLNAGHTLLISVENDEWTAEKEYIEATQDLGEHKWGSVQTWAGLSPWSCNDLRWNPAESNSNNWGGYVNWAAIDNGNKDIYGNEVRKYELFRQYDFATQGLGFGNSINIPEDQAYILVTNKPDLRKKYSEYENNEGWFETNGVKWEKSLFELIKLHMELAEQGTSDDVTDDILDKINDMIEEAGGERQDDIDSALETLIDLKTKNFGKEVSDMITDEEEGLKAKFIAACRALAKLNFDLGQAKAANENGDEYFFVQKLDDETGTWNLITVDEDTEYGYGLYDESELPDNYRQVFPMGFPHIQDGFDQEYDSDDPEQPNTYDLGDTDQTIDEFTLFEGEDEATYEGGNDIAAYEKWLKDLIAKYQGRIVDLDTDDNFYNLYVSRAEGNLDDQYFNEARDSWDAGELDIPAETQEELDALGDKKDAWEAVIAKYDAIIADYPELEDYIKGNKEYRDAAWETLNTTKKNLLKDFSDLLKTAQGDDFVSEPKRSWVYTPETLDEIKAQIAAILEPLVRESGLEELAFTLYSHAVIMMSNDWEGSEESVLEDEDYLQENFPNYCIARDNRKANYAIDMLNGYLAHLQNSRVYQAFDALRQTVGKPSVAAVEDKPETEDVNEAAAAVPATGDFLALETAVLALDEVGKALYNKINFIEETEEGEEAPARLNIIWNNRPADEVVGIMEAVTNRTVTKDGDNTIYNLNGMRVKNTGKGVFIQNGKKVIK